MNTESKAISESRMFTMRLNEDTRKKLVELANKSHRDLSGQIHWMIESAYADSMKSPSKVPSSLSFTNLIAGPALEQGVVALTCGCCKKVVGVINADAARREAENGVMHFCQECMALPEEEIVARLNAEAESEL